MSLAGHTIFISGASRGIGKAIGLRCARDGANVVIAAKTAEPHPKLPGTIYTAADEIEAAGGRALPCLVDIRDESSVRKALDATHAEFGNVDILINNASAISLTGTLSTGMKKYDLMNQVNARGTYLCSHVMMPDLIKSAQAGRHAHMMAISPPLSMKEMWFKNHTAYSIAKFGMSMSVLGMAGEFKDEGVCCNALWPRTAIWTAAMKMLGGNTDEAAAGCRTTEIMEEAAYHILTSKRTGEFIIDEDLLREKGVTDFGKYDCVPGAPLIPDFFVDDYEEKYGAIDEAAILGQAKKTVVGMTEETKTIAGIDGVFQAMAGTIATDGDALCSRINATYQFDMKDTKSSYYMNLLDAPGGCGKLDADMESPTTKFIMKEKDFVKMFKGKLKPTTAFMTGKMKIKGDMQKAMALEKLMAKMNKK
jgi:NAD(P)-dependent dehydrogenase (short-subunit alcohol dehydrogenase family)